jgi:hypothetical protein
MWGYHNYAKVNIAFEYNIVVNQKIPQRVESHICGTADEIPEYLT